MKSPFTGKEISVYMKNAHGTLEVNLLNTFIRLGSVKTLVNNSQTMKAIQLPIYK